MFVLDLQYLGYLDLNLLAKQNVHRRGELFSLSQPGGHPHNWNNVSSQCFNTLKLLTERIREFNDKASVASGHARQLSGDKTPLMKQPGEQANTCLVDHFSQRILLSLRLVHLIVLFS